MQPTKAVFAEIVGTFALVFVGAGAIIVAGESLIVVAMAHGLILAVMVSATIHISGGQLNPAVSVALAAIGKQPWPQAFMFIIGQLLGAVAAAALLKWCLSETYDIGRIGATLGSMTDSMKPETTNLARGFVLEVIATFFLMFVILGTAVDPRGVGKTATVGGFAIGLTVAADILCFGPLTGASMNPARSFGPALLAGAWDAHWLYWSAPIVGALIAAFAYRATFGFGVSEGVMNID